MGITHSDNAIFHDLTLQHLSPLTLTTLIFLFEQLIYCYAVIGKTFIIFTIQKVVLFDKFILFSTADRLKAREPQRIEQPLSTQTGCSRLPNGNTSSFDYLSH